MNDAASAALMSAGMKCLKEKLGVVKAELFITAIKDEHFDYTEWRRDNLWAGASLQDIFDQAAEYERTHSGRFGGRGKPETGVL